MRRASDGQREGRTEGGEKPPVGGRARTLAGAGTGAWQDVPRVSVGPESERPILGSFPHMPCREQQLLSCSLALPAAAAARAAEVTDEARHR